MRYDLITLTLWLLWASLLFGGFFFGRADSYQGRRMPTWTRMSSSLMLALAAWSGYVFAVGGDYGLFMGLIALGMTLGFVGDLFMAELFPLKNYIFGGIGAFGLGHIAYIAALLSVGGQLGLDDGAARWGALAIWLLLGIVGWYLIVFRDQKATSLHWAALPYALLLASTTGVATGLALQAPIFVPLAIGAALFLLSDLILAGQLFNDLHFPLSGDIVWLTYGPGQMLIVFGAALLPILASPLFGELVQIALFAHN